jgi:hypothetical protein
MLLPLKLQDDLQPSKNEISFNFVGEKFPAAKNFKL